MEIVVIIYLTLMFIALYMFSFFIILTLKNKNKLLNYVIPNKDYFVSILIPAFNEEDSIQDTIKHILELDYPKNKLEVIIINDGSTDDTIEIIEKLLIKYPVLKLLDKKNTGKADSLNQAIKIAKGELIAVADSDSFPSKESLKKLTGFFNDPKMGAVTSFVTVRNRNTNILTKIQSLEYMILGWTRKLLDFVDSVYVTNGPLSLYRKKYVLEVGGFDTTTVTEDIDITWNMLSHDYKTAMCLGARVSTVVPTKFKIWFSQRSRWGLGGLQALTKYKRLFFKKGMFGVFVLPFVSFSIIISIFGFLFSSYLVSRSILNRFIITTYSASSGASLFHFQNLNFYPSVLLFYLVILFSVSIIYYNYVLYKTKYEENLTSKRFFNLLLYILIYLSTYPIIWFHSIYRFIKKDNRW